MRAGLYGRHQGRPDGGLQQPGHCALPACSEQQRPDPAGMHAMAPRAGGCGQTSAQGAVCRHLGSCAALPLADQARHCLCEHPLSPPSFSASCLKVLHCDFGRPDQSGPCPVQDIDEKTLLSATQTCTVTTAHLASMLLRAMLKIH